MARRLPTEPDVLELDVTNPEHLAALGAELEQRWGRLDGVLHAIGFAPEACLGGDFLRAGWDDVATALHVSAYSLKALAEMALPLMKGAGQGDGRGGGSIVGLDFDATVAWPAYDWMGVAKAALESTCRYLARDLGPPGIRVNLVAAGPLKTVAAKSIAGFATFEDAWVGPGAARLGDHRPRARRPGLRRPAVGLVPRHHRRDGPRRRRLPRHRRLTEARIGPGTNPGPEPL